MSGAKSLLAPLGALYGFGAHLKNVAYDRGWCAEYRAGPPVVCVGNITAGGNGKTPLVMWLVEALRKRGHRPAVLSRGYGGTIAGPAAVSGEHEAREVGDEPLMMARRGGFSVVVSRDRVAGARFVAERGLGDLIVLDDGFQHRRLFRECNVLAVNVADDEACELFLRGGCLPAGRWREPLEDGLRRVHCSVLNVRSPERRESPLMAEVRSVLIAHGPVFRSTLTPVGLFDCETGNAVEPPPRVVALSAIAAPEGFVATIRAMGMSVSATASLPDHAGIGSATLTRLRARHAVPIVCTEKDAVKIPRGAGAGILVLRAELEIKDGEKLADFVIARCSAARSSSS